MIYFDNSATTRPYDEVVELIARLMLRSSAILHPFII